MAEFDKGGPRARFFFDEASYGDISDLEVFNEEEIKDVGPDDIVLYLPHVGEEATVPQPDSFRKKVKATAIVLRKKV